MVDVAVKQEQNKTNNILWCYRYNGNTNYIIFFNYEIIINLMARLINPIKT